MSHQMRRLDDLKLHVHELTERIEGLEKNPDTKDNRRGGIPFMNVCLRNEREKYKKMIHEREMKTMAANQAKRREFIGHYEKQLPRKENYSKKPLAYLRKKNKELEQAAGGFRSLLARGGIFAYDKGAKAFVAMYEEHRQAVLRAIEAKAGKAA